MARHATWFPARSSSLPSYPLSNSIIQTYIPSPADDAGDASPGASESESATTLPPDTPAPTRSSRRVRRAPVPATEPDDDSEEADSDAPASDCESDSDLLAELNEEDFIEALVGDPDEFSDDEAEDDDCDDIEDDPQVVPVVGDDDLIHVGQQSVDSHKFRVHAVPERMVDSYLKRTARNIEPSERELPGMSSLVVDTLKAAFIEQMKTTFTSSDDHFSRFCDYTGIPLSWTPGAMSPSLEAVNNFVRTSYGLNYHASPNFAIIGTGLNWAKSRYAPSLLPVLAVALKAADEVDPTIRWRRMAWAFNALSNVGSLGLLAKAWYPHCKQFVYLDGIDREHLRSLFEAMRTGSKSHIERHQRSLPGANMRDVAMSIVDRWGLPMVPWIGNPLRAALCKLQDHGIAMLFGVETSGEPFDPLRHIDLDRATITVDSLTTNRAMKNYMPLYWDSLRSAFTHVPLRHPFWRIDESMGAEIWRGERVRVLEPSRQRRNSTPVFCPQTSGFPETGPDVTVRSDAATATPSSAAPGSWSDMPGPCMSPRPTTAIARTQKRTGSGHSRRRSSAMPPNAYLRARWMAARSSSQRSEVLSGTPTAMKV